MDGRLFLLDSVRNTSLKITEEFKIKFINFPALDENNREKAEFNEIKNSLFGYFYINYNKNDSFFYS